MPYGVYRRQTVRDPPRTRSGLKGVIYHPHTTRRPWKAYGKQHGMYVTIGYFRTKVAAAEAYNVWAKRVFGPTAYLNPM